jgi:hypothetical protein
MLEPYKGYFAVEADMHDTALYVHIWLSKRFAVPNIGRPTAGTKFQRL